MPEPVNIACCPEHGLHGERDECFVCGGPVEQVAMVPVARATVLAQALIDAHAATEGNCDFADLDERGTDMQEALLEVRRIIRDALPAGTLEGWCEE